MKIAGVFFYLKITNNPTRKLDPYMEVEQLNKLIGSKKELKYLLDEKMNNNIPSFNKITAYLLI